VSKTDADTGSRAINSNTEAVPIYMQKLATNLAGIFHKHLRVRIKINVLGIHLIHNTQRWMSKLTKCSRLNRVKLPAKPLENIRFQ
jgi:hypothetical protein